MTSAAAVVAASVTMAPRPSAPAPMAAAAATALRAPFGQRRGLPLPIEAVHHALRLPADRLDQARALDVEGGDLGVADDALTVLLTALGQVRRDLLPLPEVGVHHPVDQLRHEALDLARARRRRPGVRIPPARARLLSRSNDRPTRSISSK